MIMQIVSELGPWAWMIAGFILLAGEIIMPGVFLIWFGLAAITIGTLVLIPFTNVSWWPWQAQVIGFGVLSLVFLLVGQKLFPSRKKGDAAASINDPLGRFQGTVASLDEPIENGVGKIRLGDTVWRVTGPDTAIGSKVKVVGHKDGALIVEPA